MINEAKLIENLEQAKKLKEISGAKLVLALKCFSTWGVFNIIKPYLDGTTSSGPYEVKLGYETFGGETHAYSVGYSEEDVREDRALLERYARAYFELRQRKGVTLQLAHEHLRDPNRFGMMMVKVEAREYRLKEIIQELEQAKSQSPVNSAKPDN